MSSKVAQRSLVASAVVGATVLTTGVAPGALNAYLRLTGQKQGAFKATVEQKGHEGSILITKVEHAIVSPRDAASGLGSGKRTAPAVGSITVTKASDATSSPALRQAVTTHETMSTAVFDGANVWGTDPNDHVTATLENAMIDSCVPPTAPPPGQSETCTITYTAVSLVHVGTPAKPPERILK